MRAPLLVPALVLASVACRSMGARAVAPGLSQALAQKRAAQVRDIRYKLRFSPKKFLLNNKYTAPTGSNPKFFLIRDKAPGY